MNRCEEWCVKNALTIGIKHIRQNVAQRKFVWANKIVVTIKKCAKLLVNGTVETVVK
jgi:hypothetical protein